MNKNDKMNSLIESLVLPANTAYHSSDVKVRNQQINSIKNTLLNDFDKEDLVEFYKKAMFHGTADGVSLILHATAFAYQHPIKDVSTINDFYVKVADNIEKEGPVSLEESANRTYLIYRNCNHIHQMKELFTQSVIRAQKGEVILGFEQQAKAEGNLSFIENMRNFVTSIKSKFKEAVKIPNSADISQKISDLLESKKPEISVDKKPSLK